MVSEAGSVRSDTNWTCSTILIFQIPKSVIFDQNVIFSPESRPAGASWAKYLISCESKVACNFSVFCSNSCFWKFDWWFQQLGVSDPTPTGLALDFELFNPKKVNFLSGSHFFARKSSRRGLLSKMFDKLRIQGRMQIFEKTPRVLEITFWYCRTLDLDESFQNIPEGKVRLR